MTATTKRRLLRAATFVAMLLAELWIQIGWRWFVVIAVLGANLLAAVALGLFPFEIDSEGDR